MEPYRERANHELRAQRARGMGRRLAGFVTGVRCASGAIREGWMAAVYHGWLQEMSGGSRVSSGVPDRALRGGARITYFMMSDARSRWRPGGGPWASAARLCTPPLSRMLRRSQGCVGVVRPRVGNWCIAAAPPGGLVGWRGMRMADYASVF